MRIRQISLFVSSLALLVMCVQPVLAEKKGSLIVRVSPKETYIYADGEPVYESKGHYITLTPGEHKIDLYNYAYMPETRKVTITAHETTKIDVAMRAIPGVASGPWGCITIEGPHGAAVLLNGKDPEAFFVGNVKEFNNDFLWKKELIVPPGKHELTIAYALQAPWTTTVDVEANHRVVVDAFKGVRKTVSWSRGEQMKEVARFRGGLLNDHVAVQKVGGQFSASAGQVNCGESAHLIWSSTGATKTEINDAAVSASGDQTVQPKQNTSYKFTAAGPGGVYTSDAMVNVSKEMPVSLNVTPGEVNYKSSDPGANRQTAKVTWSAANADSVTLDPIGSVSASGSREIPVTPSSTAPGPIDQTVTYTLHATNACGASETRTATLHITGSNEVLEGAVNSTPAPPAESPQIAAAAPVEMPQTASQLPLMGLIGILSMVAAATIHRFLKMSA